MPCKSGFNFRTKPIRSKTGKLKWNRKGKKSGFTKIKGGLK